MASTSTLRLIIQALDEFSGELNKLSGMVNTVATEVTKVEGQAGKAAKSLTQMAQTSTAFQQLGIRLAAVGAALSASVFFPIQAAAEFERALDRVVAVTEGAQTAFKALERTASELGRTTRYTATEAAEGMRFLGMAGFDAAETMSAIGPALQLASAGQMDLASAADISTNIMTAMRVPVEELAHVVDVLAKTSTSSNTSVVQMAEALKYTAPLAQSAGVSLEQVAAAIGVLGNNGIQASLAGTSLRGMFLSLAAPTKRARDTLASMGVVIARNNDGTIDFIETLKRFRDANITLAEANDLFLRRSAAGAVALSQQVDEVEKLTKANIDSVRAGTEMYNLMEGNLIGAVILLSSAFNGLLRSLGEPLLKPIEGVVRELAKVVSTAAELIAEMPLLTKIVMTLVGSAGVLAATIGALAVAMGGWVQIQRAAVVVEIVKHWKLYIAAVKEATAITIAFFTSSTKAAQMATAIDLLTLKVRNLGLAIKLAFETNVVGASLKLILAAAAALSIAVAYFYKSTAQLIDAQKKLGAELDDYKKSLSDLDNALKANANDTEAYAETTIKLRTHMLEVAKSSSTMRERALAVANSIDILNGKFIDGGKALREYRIELQQQKFETLAKQVYLYSEALRSAQGDTFWSAYFRDTELGWAKFWDLYNRIGNLGGLIGKVSDYTGQVVKKHELEMRVGRENIKLAANEIIAALEKMGQIDFEWTEGELRAALRALGVTYEDAIKIYIEQFNRFRDTHKETNKAMLADSVYKNDETVRHFKEAVDKQIADLKRLKEAQLEAVAQGNADAIGSLSVEIEAAQASLSDAIDKYETSITDRRMRDAKATMRELRKTRLEYQKFREETNKIYAENKKDPRLDVRYQQAAELKKYLLDLETSLNTDMELVRQQNMNKVVKLEEERTQDIEHNEKLQAISTEEAERQRLESAIQTAEGRLKAITEENRFLAAGLGEQDVLVRASAAAQLEAIQAVTKARKAAADYELELVFKNAAELQRAADKAESSKLQTLPDDLDKFAAQAAAELKELDRNFGEKLRAGEKYEQDRQAQIINSRELIKKYSEGEQTEEKKQNIATLKNKIAELEKSSKQYRVALEKYATLENNIIEKYAIEGNEWIKKQDEKRQKEILERMRAELEEKKQLLDEELSLSEYNYQKGNISLEQHYENRRRIIAEKIDGEIALLHAKLAAAKTDEEKLTLTAQIKVKRVEETIRLSKEERTRTDDIEANERAVQNSLIDIRRKALTQWEFEERAKIEREAFALRQKQELEAFNKRNQEKFSSGKTWEQNLTQFTNDQAKERANFERKQRLELEKQPLVQEAEGISLKESVIPEFDVESRLKAERDAEINSYKQRLIDFQNFTDNETEIAKFAEQTREAITRREAEHEQEVLQYRLSLASQWSSDMADYFGGLYEASGKSIKEFFYLQKAAAIAQTIIDTYAAAQKAFKSQAEIPGVGPYLAGAAAAAAVAQGMARVYAIQSQTLATGGKVEEQPDFEQNVKLGKKIVPIRVTAKEWKFPKERVGQYGTDLFEALKEKAIPKPITDIMLGKRSPSGRSKVVSGYGEVPGFSPHPKADNIESFARPGDFVLPVDAAKRYGKDFMQALFQGKIPTNWLELFSARKVSKLSGGGEVDSDPHRIKRFVPTKWIDIIQENKPIIKKVIQKPKKDRSIYTKDPLARMMGRGKPQRFSEGGEVSGVSPHPEADNIPIWATAAEWVMPVKAVRRYGKQVMAAIQQGLIPTELFSSLKLPTINIPSPPVRYSYATGGQVSSGGAPSASRGMPGGGGAGQAGAAAPINIVNVVDSSLIDQYLSSTSGQKLVLNVLSANQPAARRAILGRI